jgi:hypothetical protein
MLPDPPDSDVDAVIQASITMFLRSYQAGPRT